MSAPTIDHKNFLVITNLPNENDPIDGNTNKPKIRHKNILDSIRDKHDFFLPKQELTTDIIKNLNVHSPDYLEFLENAWISFKENYDKDFDPHSDYGLVPYYFYQTNINYKKIPSLWKRVGYFCHDVTTPIYESTWQIAMLSANNSYTAAKQIKYYDVIYCLNSYPSHHCSYSSYGGYCYLNNNAICIKQYQKLNPNNKVAIIDIDYHHGQGTQEIFYKDPSVFTLSIHSDPQFDYPSTGFEDEVGEGDGTNYNKNYIFSKGVTSEEYIGLIRSCIEDITKYNPDLVIVAFGGDTYKDDKDCSNLYGASLEEEDYYDIGKEFKKLNKKTIISQEGGYCMEKIGSIVNNFINGLAS